MGRGSNGGEATRNRWAEVSHMDRFMKKIKISGDCWIWIGSIHASGYGQFNTSPRPNQKTERAHRVSWKLFKGEIPNGMIVCHKCDTPACVNPEHLFIGNASDNMQDMIIKRRRKHIPSRGINGRFTREA